jgi:hypothetical protein
MARFVIMVLVALSMLGCDSEDRYYCVAEGPPPDIGCFLCRGGDCWRQDPPERSACVTDTDCEAGAQCSSRGCVELCTDDAHCPLGTACTEEGLCLNPTETDPSPAPDPTADPSPGGPDGPSEPEGFCPTTPCQEGRLCLDGECRTPCDTDEDCAAVDASIRFCRSVVGRRLCLRSGEALSRCQLAIDCAFGELCEEGNCVAASGASAP